MESRQTGGAEQPCAGIIASVERRAERAEGEGPFIFGDAAALHTRPLHTYILTICSHGTKVTADTRGL